MTRIPNAKIHALNRPYRVISLVSEQAHSYSPTHTVHLAVRLGEFYSGECRYRVKANIDRGMPCQATPRNR